MIRRLAVLLASCAACVSCAAGAGRDARPVDVAGALGAYFSGASDEWGAVTPAQLKSDIDARTPFLLDVREPAEVAAGHIAGSANVPIRSLIKHLDRLPAPGDPIVVTCGTGHRSAIAMLALNLLGYTDVSSLAGGLRAWKAAGLPIESGPSGDAGRPLHGRGSRGPERPALLADIDRTLGGLPDGWGTLAPNTLRDLIGTSKPFQLDVRKPREVAARASIPGARNIPLRRLVERLDALPPDRAALIVVECGDGHRSAMAMFALRLLGFTDVRALAGGLDAWASS